MIIDRRDRHGFNREQEFYQGGYLFLSVTK
jgi:hypothetical protein